MTACPRRTLSVLAALSLLTVPFTTFAQDVAPAATPVVAPPAPPAAKPAIPAKLPWLYEGSDVPVDTSWTFGTLSNGLRYAVKRNGVPPGQVSIRIRIDAGALHEKDSELGFAHLIEHLTFRGSTYVPDGEAKRIWQRFGATFGSDSNAQTTPTQTVYKLDLPAATDVNLDESFKILSGMIRAPRITDQSVGAERQIVLAELREGSGPQLTLSDTTRALFFEGQLLAKRSPIGTIQTLQAAQPAALQAFHDRWYRPENVVLVASGDVDPAMLEQLTAKYFGDWKEAGKTTPEPDFGKPVDSPRKTAVVVDPTLPSTLTMMIARPWAKKNDTIIYNEGILIDLLALQMINRRLEAKARAGGSYLAANVSQDDFSRTVDGTFVSIVPIGDDWEAALKDVRAVIADATITAPSPEDIQRELTEFTNAFQIGVDSYPFEAAAKQADDIVNAVDIRETVATPQVALDVLKAMTAKFTPARLLSSTQRLFKGVTTRVVMSSPTEVQGGEGAIATALAAPVTADTGARLAQGTVGLDALPDLGPAGTVASARKLSDMLDMEEVTLSNGVRALLYPNDAESGKIKVLVRFGRGYQAFAPGQDTLLWSGELALVESGVGELGQEGLDRLTNGRRIGMKFDIDDDAFELSADTRPSDLDGQLKLFAGKLAFPRWDAAPVNRAKAMVQTGYKSYEMSADAVLQRDLSYLLRGSDPRWKVPGPDEIARLTPEAFRKTWEPILQTGPVEIFLFGDFQRDAAIKALTETFGALPQREASPTIPGADSPQFPETGGAPIRLAHRGPADQTAVVVAWPTGGGLARIRESRQLEILTEIFKDRLFEGFRAEEAASYSPYVISNWSRSFPTGGYVAAISQVQPENVQKFIDRAKAIAVDLATKPVTADELGRAVEPVRQLVMRASTGNAFWLNQLEGATYDPNRFLAIRSLMNDYTTVTPAEIQQLAATYLKPDAAYVVEVLPTAVPGAPAVAGGAGDKTPQPTAPAAVAPKEAATR